MEEVDDSVQRWIVREAVAGDTASLVNLYRSLVPTSSRLSVHPARLERIRQDECNFVFVAEHQGEVKGTVFLTLCLDPMYRARPFGVVENLVVEVSARRRGGNCPD